MEGLGKVLGYVAPVAGWVVGQLANNIFRIEMPASISNKVIEKTAQTGQKYFGTLGHWAGTAIGGYYGVKAANNPMTMQMVQWGATGLGVVSGALTSSVLTLIGNRLKQVNISKETEAALGMVQHLPEGLEDKQIMTIVNAIIAQDKHFKSGKISQEDVKDFIEDSDSDVQAFLRKLNLAAQKPERSFIDRVEDEEIFADGAIEVFQAVKEMVKNRGTFGKKVSNGEIVKIAQVIEEAYSKEFTDKYKKIPPHALAGFIKEQGEGITAKALQEYIDTNKVPHRFIIKN